MNAGEDYIIKLKQGDTASFELVYKEYYKLLYILAFRFVRSEDDAHDMVHKTFLRLWEQKADLRAETLAQLINWLKLTTRNSCFDFLQSLAIKDSKEEDIRRVYMNLEPHQVYEATDKEASYIDYLMEQIRQLPPAVRQTFVLRWLHELSFREISEKLNIDISTIQKRYARAVKRMRSGIPDGELIILFMILTGIAIAG